MFRKPIRLLACATLVALGTRGLTTAEDFSSLGLKSNQSSKRNAGSAAVLSGTALMYQVFVADETSSWSEDEKARVRNNVKESQQFIIGESKRYDITLAFRDENVEDVLYPGVVPTDTFVDPRWTEEVLRKVNGQSGNELVAALRDMYQVDSVLICLHVNKPGLSYNLAHYDGVEATYAAERMICFTRYPDGRPTAAATYAHEILHVFGAGDLYFPYDKTNRRKEKARRMWPNDVMRRVDYDIRRLNIGAFTAFRVGWSDQLKPDYRGFED